MWRMFEAIDTVPRPVIGRVHGAALGGGMGLIACCDIVVAAEGTVFGFTETRLGIIPAVISGFVVPKVGVSWARALFLTGERFDTDRAREIHLVHAVVSEGELNEAVARKVDEMLLSGPEAVGPYAVALLRGMPSFALSVAVVAEGKNGERRTGFYGGGGRVSFSHFDTFTPELVAREAARQAIATLGAVDAHAGQSEWYTIEKESVMRDLYGLAAPVSWRAKFPAPPAWFRIHRNQHLAFSLDPRSSHERSGRYSEDGQGDEGRRGSASATLIE